ncbi:MAG: hypothetical protein ACHQ03_06350 [Candidatus Bathyarchaeia archaeon]
MPIMRAYSLTYRFSQRLPVPARQAYLWCTDYKPNDLSLMNMKGLRKIERISSDTIILREVVDRKGKKIKKIKLIKLPPAALSWHNLQISGPNKYSEFLYQIQPINRRASKLILTGRLVIYGNVKLAQRAITKIASNERRSDSPPWKLLAKAMANQLKVIR